MKRVLGIDPGLRITGFGAMELRDAPMSPKLLEAGIIKLNGAEAMEQRLAELYQSLAELVDELRPCLIAVETLYAHYRHPRTAILMGHARGVILLCARQRGVPVEHLPATEVKRAITGHGHASKEQMQLAIQTQCGLTEPPHPPDIADAIALALTCARRLALT